MRRMFTKEQLAEMSKKWALKNIQELGFEVTCGMIPGINPSQHKYWIEFPIGIIPIHIYSDTGDSYFIDYVNDVIVDDITSEKHQFVEHINGDRKRIEVKGYSIAFNPTEDDMTYVLNTSVAGDSEAIDFSALDGKCNHYVDLSDLSTDGGTIASDSPLRNQLLHLDLFKGFRYNNYYFTTFYWSVVSGNYITLQGAIYDGAVANTGVTFDLSIDLTDWSYSFDFTEV